MKQRSKTGFDAYLAQQLERPLFRREFEAATAEIEAVDALVRALDARREEVGLSKAELARRVDMSPEVIRRLFTAAQPNPTLATVLRLALALECGLELTTAPRQAARRPLASRRRTPAVSSPSAASSPRTRRAMRAPSRSPAC